MKFNKNKLNQFINYNNNYNNHIIIMISIKKMNIIIQKTNNFNKVFNKRVFNQVDYKIKAFNNLLK